MNWNRLRLLYSRPFRSLAMWKSIRRLRTPAELADALRRGNAYVTNITSLRWYESRFATTAAAVPTGPHPWAPACTWSVKSRAAWLRVCSFFEWECVIKRENGRYAWRYPAAVVRVAPHLQFKADEAKNALPYYSNIRMALLAYDAFPNSGWEAAYSLKNVVPKETADRKLGAFAAEDPRVGIPPQLQPWCGFHDFLRPK